MIKLPATKVISRKRRGIGQLGVTLFEVVLGLGVMGIAMTGLASMQMNQTVELRNQSAAQNLRIVRDAARRYVRDNFSDVSTNVTNGGGVYVIPNINLINGGYLPPQYISAGDIRQNSYNQTYRIVARRDAAAPASTLEMLVVTMGGGPIPNNTLAQVASMVGADGGYVCTATTSGLCGSPTAPGTQISRGAYGGWEVNMANFGGGFTTGHLAASANFGQGEIVTDYLYRYAVPGLPEANRMFTNLDMNNNNINNAAQVNAVESAANPNCVRAQLDGPNGLVTVKSTQGNGCRNRVQMNGSNATIDLMTAANSTVRVRLDGESGFAQVRDNNNVIRGAMKSDDNSTTTDYAIAAFDTAGTARAVLRTDGRLQLRVAGQGSTDSRIVLRATDSTGVFRDGSNVDRVNIHGGSVTNPGLTLLDNSAQQAAVFVNMQAGNQTVLRINRPGSTSARILLDSGVGSNGGAVTTYTNSNGLSTVMEAGINNSIYAMDPNNPGIQTAVMQGRDGFILARAPGTPMPGVCGTENPNDTSQLNTVCMKGSRNGGGDIWVGKIGWLGDAFRWIHYDTYVRTSGGFVPYPSCKAGSTPKVVVTPGTFIQPLQFNGMASGAAFRVAADNTGGGWIVGVQTVQPNLQYTGSVVAMTYCYRP